jgi:hypothetical protein
MKYVNRSSPNNVSIVSLNLYGNWRHVISSNETLSCNLIYNQMDNNISFLKFDLDSGSFYVYANVQNMSNTYNANSLSLG